MKQVQMEQAENDKITSDYAAQELSQSLIKIKNNVESFLEICDSIDVILWEIEPKQEFTARQMIVFHLIKFCIYLSASSSNITETDAKIINSIFSESYSAEILRAFAEKENLSKNHFGCTIPPIMPLFISLEAPEVNIQCVEQLLDIHRVLATEIIKLTGRSGDDLESGMSYVRRLELYKNTVSYKKLNNIPDSANTASDNYANDAPPWDTSSPAYNKPQIPELDPIKSSLLDDNDEVSDEIDYERYLTPTYINLPEYKRGTKVFHKKYGNGVIVSQINYKIIILFLNDRTMKFDVSKSDEKESIEISSMCNSNIQEELDKKYQKYIKSKTLSSGEQPLYLKHGPEDYMAYTDYLNNSDWE